MKTKRLFLSLFVMPFLFFLVLWVVVPLGYSLYLSFFANRMGHRVFIGFNNYIAAVHDQSFWDAMLRVLKFGVFQVLIMICLALLISLLLDSKLSRFRAFFRLIYFLPYAVPGVVAAIMWGFLYAPSLDPLLSLFSPHHHAINPLSEKNLLTAIINIVVWELTGYNVTLYYSALTSIPLELYDSAKIDGCGELRTALLIKIPLIKSTIVMTLVLSVIGAMQLFNEPFLLSQLTEIPLAYTPNTDIFNMAFSIGDISYSATLSVILGGICIIASIVFLILSKRIGHSRKTLQI